MLKTPANQFIKSSTYRKFQKHLNCTTQHDFGMFVKVNEVILIITSGSTYLSTQWLVRIRRVLAVVHNVAYNTNWCAPIHYRELSCLQVTFDKWRDSPKARSLNFTCNKLFKKYFILLIKNTLNSRVSVRLNRC